MDNNKLSWCFNQKEGIKIIDIKDHLSKSYMNEADETLIQMLKLEGKWKTITAYYGCYNAFYSILMKCGVKSEIHTCTINLMNFFDFEVEEKLFMEKLKEDRIQAQYYLKERILNDENKVKDFIHKCKLISIKLNKNEIEKIRKELELIKITQIK